MNAHGRDCTIFMIIGSRILSIPYSAETLRDAPTLIRREATLGDDRGSTILGDPGVRGCIVTPLTGSSAPVLLALAFEDEAPAEWVSETKSLHRHTLTQRYRDDGITFQIIQNRVARARRYRDVQCTGYQLRGTAGALLQLKLTIAGAQGSEDAGYYLQPALVPEELFRFETTALYVDGERCWGFYSFCLMVTKTGTTRGAEIRLHTALNERSARLLSTRTIGRIDLDFPLLRTYAEEHRLGRFTLSVEDLILRADESMVDCADELIGPRRYLINGQLRAQVYTSDGERLLP